MSQHDLVIDNAPGASVRSDLNSALQALGSMSKGGSRMATPYAGQPWIDDNTPSTSVWSWFVWTGSADIKIGELDTTGNNFMPFVNGMSLTSFLAAYTFPGTEATLPSSATTNLGSTGVFAVAITGTTNISSFGSGANTSAPLYFIRFTGTLQLTHNGTSLILPGGGNITTAAGATAIALYLGSGNWRVLHYSPALSASQLLGVGSSGGKAAISLGTGLSMSGNTLNATPPTPGLPASVSGSLSSGTTATFTVDFSTYSAYDIFLEGVTGSVTANNLSVNVSSNGGSSYATASRSNITFNGSVAGGNVAYDMLLNNGSVSALVGTLVQGVAGGAAILTYTSGYPAQFTQTGITRFSTSAAINRVQLSVTGGTFSTGNVILQPASLR